MSYCHSAIGSYTYYGAFMPIHQASSILWTYTERTTGVIVQLSMKTVPDSYVVPTNLIKKEDSSSISDTKISSRYFTRQDQTHGGKDMGMDVLPSRTRLSIIIT